MSTHTFFKSVSMRFGLTPEQEAHMLQGMFNPQQALLIRLFLHKYNDRDDGLQQELAPTVDAALFGKLCTELRQGVLADGHMPRSPEQMKRAWAKTQKKRAEGDEAKDPNDKISSKVSSRALTAPLFSGSSMVGDSTALCRTALSQLRQLGVLPLATVGNKYDQFNTIEGAIEFVRSYVDCDQRTRLNYQKETQKLQRLQEVQTYLNTLSATEALQYVQMVAGDAELSETEAEELRADQECGKTIPVVRAIYKDIQHWLENKEKAATKYKQVLEEPLTPRKAIAALVKKQERRLQGTRPESQLTLPTPERPLPFRLGSNFCDFRLEQSGPVLMLTICRGSLQGTYRLSYGSGKAKGGLTRHLAVSKEDAYTTKYRLTYQENGKRLRQGLLMEPRVMYRKTKQGSGFYLAMPLNMQTEMPSMFQGSLPAYSRYYPRLVEGADKLESLRVLGVDLGIDPAFAWVVYEGRDFQKGIPTTLIECDKGMVCSTAFSHSIKTLNSKCDDLKWVLRVCVGARTRGETIQTAVDRYRRPTNFEAAVQRFFPDHAQFYAHTESLPVEVIEDAAGVEFHSVRKWRTPGVWQLGAEVAKLLSEYRKLREMRRTATADNLADNLWWQSLLRTIASMHTAWETMGKKSSTFPGKTTMLSNLHELKLRCQVDNRKKHCRRIVDEAVRNKCSVIAVEDLVREARQDLDNRLWDLWSPRSMLELLLQMANAEGIGVIKVQVDCTSKTIYDGYRTGWRDKENKRRIYTLTDGRVTEHHADLNAARNVAALGLTRHAKPLFYWVRNVDGRIVPMTPEVTAAEVAAEEKRPAVSAEEKAKKKLRVAKVKKDRADWVRAQTLFGDFSCWQHLVPEIKPNARLKIYRQGDTWISAKMREVQEKAIELAVKHQQPQAAE